MKPHALRRHRSIAPAGARVVLPALHPAARSARSIFLSRIFAPDEVQRVLKTGHQSRKIGKRITKGGRAGWPIFTLTLEERATCPATCAEWLTCYGNNMQAAERIEAGAELEAALRAEIAALAAAHPDGFLLRLHVLGDFYSLDYVDLWADLLGRHAALHLFGFTAHAPRTPLGRAVEEMIERFGFHRVAIRFSGAAGEKRSSRVLSADQPAAGGILCPAQTGATDCCATCALCWQSETTILFRRH